MWRKFNKAKDPPIGAPTLIETTFDQQYLDTIPEIDSLRSGHSSAGSPSLPAFSFKTVEPPTKPPTKPPPQDRSSSLYSQNIQNTLSIPQHDSHRVSSIYSEVSPLNSPRGSAEFDHDSPDVSPIDARRSPEFPASKPKSQIPTMRKMSLDMTHSQSEAGGGNMGDDRETRLARVREKNRKLLSGFQERISQNKETKKNESMDHPLPRVPWKGASGRTALVDPVRTTAQENQAQAVPRRKEAPRPRREAVDSSPTPVGKSGSSHDMGTLQPVIPSIEEPDDMDKPVVPLKVKSPVTTENLSGPFNPRYSDATVSSYEDGRSELGAGEHGVSRPRRHATNASVDTLDRLRPMTGEGEAGSRFSWTTIGTTPPPKTPEQEASSRFSWTTIATSVHDSPNNVNTRDHTPPMPPLPNLPNSLALRQRAHPSQTDPTSAPRSRVSRKPTPTEISNLYMDSGSPTIPESKKSPTTTEPDRSKSLPQCPPEMEAKDRIATLEARADELKRRRHNIDQILKELGNVVQPTNFACDLASREEVKRTVKNLEDELGEIRIEEHKVGMTLHRALKKRDQENIYGYPTGLWVKRVTS